MKKLVVFVFVFIFIVLCGCSKRQEANISSRRTESFFDNSTCLTNTDAESRKDESSVLTKSYDEKNDTNSTSSEEEIKNSSSSSPTDKTVSSNAIESPQPPKKVKETDSGKKASGQSQTSSNNSSTKSQVNQTSEPVATEYVSATDSLEISKLVMKYIKEHRLQQGSPQATVLSGLSQYDVVRSKQIVTNFAHDLDDMRAASALLKYGKYTEFEDSRFDPQTGTVSYTGKKISYYDSGDQEAIGRGGAFFKTVDEIAHEIADGFLNSPGHWSYLGRATNRYIGCGVTIQNGNWYCCISVAENNTDLLK